MYKQIIIARKDLKMSAGKLAAQVSHASMAFLTTIIRNNTVKRYDNLYIAWESKKDNKPQWYLRPDLHEWAKQARAQGEDYFYAQPVDPKDPYGKLELCEPTHHYKSTFKIENNIYENWLDGEYTKVVLQAKNKNNLLKAVELAKELGMKEGKDYFLVRDNCHTELTPEEDGRTLTCIGFSPMNSDVIDKIGRKYHTYIG